MEELHLDLTQPCAAYFSRVCELNFAIRCVRTFKRGGTNLKRILWSFGVGLGGFFIGGIGGGPAGSSLGFVWGTCIGYGFGSIVINKQATKRLVVYWGFTMALIGTFFGLVFGAPVEPSVAKETVAGAIGAAAGMLLGFLVGIIHLWQLRRKSRDDPHSDSVT